MAGSAAEFEFGAGKLSTGEIQWTDARERPAEHGNDLEVAAALRAGEDAAYERLLSRYEDPIYNLIYRLLHSPAMPKM